MTEPRKRVPVSVTVNGEEHTREVPGRMLLAHFLRDELGMTGTHVGCETSVCGCCTVLVDGDRVKSCAMLAVQADGRRIRTIEGLAEDGELTDLQESFSRHHALQCGYCTPGMVMAATALLDENPDPTREEIEHGLSGNLCRCTGYRFIVNAIEDLSGENNG